MTVKVKSLVWENFDAWTYWAKCVFGTYRVQERNGVWKAILDRKDNDDLIYEYTTDGLTPNDFEAAQIAAQADYEARILAAIEAPAREPVQVREAGAYTARGIADLNMLVHNLSQQGFRIIAVIDTQNGDYHVVAQKDGIK